MAATPLSLLHPRAHIRLGGLNSLTATDSPGSVYTLCMGERGSPSAISTRLDALDDAMRCLTAFGKPLLLVLPAGFDVIDGEVDSTGAKRTILEVQQRLQRVPDGSIICFGIDALSSLDQLAFAVDQDSVIARARKFHRAKREPKETRLARDPLKDEDGYRRCFSFEGRTFFLSVCYDCFGISKRGVINPGVDAVLDFAHWFSKSGPHSGASYYARFGLAGAAQTWKVPVLAAAAFEDNVRMKWPSGIRRGARTGKQRTYSDIQLVPTWSSQWISRGGIDCVIRGFLI
jgi:hypothetical protein